MAPKKEKQGKAGKKEDSGPRTLTEEDFRSLTQLTAFNKAELNALFAMFRPHLPEGQDAADVRALASTPAIAVHPLIQRVLLMHNQNKSGRMTFAEFASAMRSLSVRATLEQKLKFTFDLYDMNGSGTIQPAEMFQMLRMMLGRAHDDGDLHKITLAYLNRFPAGFTFDIFCQMFDVSDLNKLTLNL